MGVEKFDRIKCLAEIKVIENDGLISLDLQFDIFLFTLIFVWTFSSIQYYTWPIFKAIIKHINYTQSEYIEDKCMQIFDL